MPIKKIFASALTVAALSALSSQADAAVTYYTSQTAYAAALAESTTETFSSTPLTSGLSYKSDAGSVAGGVFSDRVVNGGASTTFSFGGDVNGFGGFFDETPGGFGQGIVFSLTFVGGTQATLSQHLDDDAGDFFGFISTDAFSSVLLTGGTTPGGTAETYNLDNVQFGTTTAAVPEPASIALMLAGLGLVGAAARRRAAK